MTVRKTRERFFLNEFLSRLKLLDSATILESEKPDFVVEFSDKGVGIEITEYYQGVSAQGSKAKENEVVWDEILGHVSTELGKRGLNHFTGLVFTRSQEPPKRNERPILSNELITLANNNPPPINSTTQVEIKFEALRNLRLYRFVRKIILIGTRTAEGVDWKRAETIASPVGFSDSELRDILKSKEKRILAYNRSLLNELWLLIVAPGETAAGTGDILGQRVQSLAERNSQVLSQAGFDQIWYFSWLPEFVVRLHPR